MPISKQQNELLTRIEGDAPMGRMLRENYWVPACLSSQLEAGGAPRRVRLFGKDHVAFRADDGRIGFLDENCPHRGASLVLGHNDGCTLRCVFHGWKFDVDGKTVAVPTQSENAEAFAKRVPRHHYSVHEGGGIVWAWLGSGPARPFPDLPFTIVPESQVWMTVTKAYCNWLQGVETTLDSAHVGTLHESYISKLKADRDSREDAGQRTTHSLSNLAPRYEIDHTPYGLDAVALRALPNGDTYMRTTPYIMPFISLTPFGEPDVPAVIFIVSPIDDYHHNLFYGAWSLTRDLGPEQIPDFMSFAIGNLPYDVNNFGGFTAGRDDNFGQDRRAMMEDGHFSGMVGNLLQEDMVAQASMGAIVDRTKEYLSSCDIAVVKTREVLLAAIKDFEEGRPVRGTDPAINATAAVPRNVLIPAGRNRKEAALEALDA